MVEFLKGLSFLILPLGFGRKRLEFLEREVRRFGGAVSEGAVSHVVVEDSVCGDRRGCGWALRGRGLEGREGVVYVRAEWLRKCLGGRRLVETGPFEVRWMREGAEGVVGGESVGGKRRREEEVRVGEQEVQASCSQWREESCQKKKIVEELEKLMKAYSIRKESWRSHGYRKAINAIKVYGKDIESFEEACRIPGVGEKMALKVMEIIESGRLRKVDEVVDEKTKVLDVFCRIWGVGPSTAEGWYVQGFRTLEDLSSKAKLTKQQRVGLELYDELQRRIPRDEVVRIAEIVESEVRKCDDLSVELVGSFRRGKPTCGDVDCMIVNSGTRNPLDILIQTTEALKRKGYLPHDLVSLHDYHTAPENHHKKYFGVFRLPGQTHRRIDLFVVPKSEYAAALLHYTGSALFNRSIKLCAARKNMTLTEHGLYAGTVRKGSRVTCRGQLVATPTERDVFSALGLPYRQPEDRDL